MYAKRRSTMKGFASLAHSLPFSRWICEVAETCPLQQWHLFLSSTFSDDDKDDDEKDEDDEVDEDDEY